MRRTSAFAIGLLLMVGLTGNADAATKGSYRCVALQGVPGGTTLTLPVFMHYNPNKNVAQSIRRVQMWDELGTLLFDTGQIPADEFVVPALGSFPILVFPTTKFTEGIQVKVKWSQTADKKPAIGKVNLFQTDPTLYFFTSVSQSDCQ